MPLIGHIQAKFYEMTDEGTEYSIPYDEIVPVLIEGGFDGYLSSEYEGNRHIQDAFAVDSVEQVRRQHAMFARLLGEEDCLMFDQYIVCEENFRARDDGRTGGVVEVRMPYYRGLTLSMVEAVDLTLDGTPVPAVAHHVHGARQHLRVRPSCRRPPTTGGRWGSGPARLRDRRAAGAGRARRHRRRPAADLVHARARRRPGHASGLLLVCGLHRWRPACPRRGVRRLMPRRRDVRTASTPTWRRTTSSTTRACPTAGTPPGTRWHDVRRPGVRPRGGPPPGDGDLCAVHLRISRDGSPVAAVVDPYPLGRRARRRALGHHPAMARDVRQRPPMF